MVIWENRHCEYKRVLKDKMIDSRDFKYVFDRIKLYNGVQKVSELHYPKSQGREETLLTAAWIFQMLWVENQRAYPYTPNPNHPTAPSAGA